jgi:hypothetical protein
VTGESRKLHNEELNYVYCSPNIARVIKSRRMRWAGHVALMGGGVRCVQVLYNYIYITAIGLTPGGSNTAHIYIQTVHRIHRTEHI